MNILCISTIDAFEYNKKESLLIFGMIAPPNPIMD